MTFVVIGDTNADVRGSLDAFPKEGDDTTVRESSWHSGGSAANTAVALAKLGAKVRLVSRVGVDPAAETALSEARKAGVDLTHVQRDENVPTGLCFAAISPNGERTLFGFRGANVQLGPVDPSVLDGATWLHIDSHALLGLPQGVSTFDLILAALDRGVVMSIDLCLPFARHRPPDSAVRSLLKAFQVIFGNQQEIELMGHLVEPASTLVHKLGAEGSRVGGFAVPAFRIAPRDTTGCGDAFVAGYLAVHYPVPTALLVGNAVGAITAARPGAAESTPSLAELRAFLDSQHEMGALLALVRLQDLG